MKKRTILIILFIVLTIIVSLIMDKTSQKKEKLKEENMMAYTEEDLNTLDMFYTEEILKKISRPDTLPLDYSEKSSQEDGYYTRSLNGTYNQKVFKKFIKDYEKEKKAFLRFVLFTDDGDAIINDISYDPNLSPPITLLIDYVRDRYSVIGVIDRTFDHITKTDKEWRLEDAQSYSLVLGRVDD